MPNSACISGPPFSITGQTIYAGQDVAFQFSFDNTADQASVLAYQWYLNDALVIDNTLFTFSTTLACGSYKIGGRILSEQGWSGIQSLNFQTCVQASLGAVIKIDLYGDESLNAIGVVYTEDQNMYVNAYTGSNIAPPGIVADALVIASDEMNEGGAGQWRFEFNVTQLLTDNPSIGILEVYLAGRSITSQTLTGLVTLIGPPSVQLTMNGIPGSYVPGTTDGIILQEVPFSFIVESGADGTYSVYFPRLLLINYDIVNKIMDVIPTVG